MIKENYRKYHILAKCGFPHFSVNNYTVQMVQILNGMSR